MFELIRRTVLAGLGAATLTKEKVEELVDELIKRGEVASEKRPKVVQELLAKVEESGKELQERVDKAAKEAVERLGIPTKADLDALHRKMDDLVRKVEKMGKSHAK